MGLFRTLFGGRKARVQQVPTISPQQQQVQSELLSQISPLLGEVREASKAPLDIEPILQQARTSFYENVVPTLAERFTAMGSGAQRSSAFPAALGRAGASLQEALAALRARTELQKRGIQLQGAHSVLGPMMGIGMQPSFMNIYQPPSPGFLSGLLGQAAPGLLSMLGSSIGLPGNVLTSAGLGLGL